MRAVSVVLLLVSIALAGCASSEGANPLATQGPGPVASGEPIVDAATIAGLVVDDSQAPIEGALVAIVGIGLQASTDAAGSFQFVNVPPGPHDVTAIKLGFSSTGKRVTVEASQQLTGVILTLTPIAVEAAYHEIFGPYSGYFNCFYGTPITIRPCTYDPSLNDAVFDDTRRQAFKLSANHWATIVGESRWTQGAFATGVGMAIYPSYSERDGSHWWCEADGRSPLIFRYDAIDPEVKDGVSVCNSQGELDPMPSMDINPLVLVADPGFGGESLEKPPLRLMLQQRFELMTTVFYGDPAPPEFSALKDA